MAAIVGTSLVAANNGATLITADRSGDIITASPRPHNVVFALEGKDYLRIEPEGISWRKNRDDEELTKIENSEELAQALTIFFEGMTGHMPDSLPSILRQEGFNDGISFAKRVIRDYPNHNSGFTQEEIEIVREIDDINNRRGTIAGENVGIV